MSQRNWIILAAVVAVLLIGYFVWPSSKEPAADAPEATEETTQ